MRRANLLALLVVLVGLIGTYFGVSAQTYGTWDTACHTGFPERFSAPFIHGVYYQDKEFLTPWRAISGERPLPSKTWYKPEGTVDIPDVNNQYLWYSAQIEVHCTVERNP